MTSRIIISPLSNEPLRDWPMESFLSVADICVEQLDAVVEFVGTRQQRVIVSQYLRTRSPEHCINLCGQHDWAGTAALIRSATCVLANNSGVAHLAASLGVPTVCVFCASHSPLEWGPRGPKVAVLTTKPSCAPCGSDQMSDCAFGRRCFVDLDPQFVFRQMLLMCQPWRVAATQTGEADTADGSEVQGPPQPYVPPWRSRRIFAPRSEGRATIRPITSPAHFVDD